MWSIDDVKAEIADVSKLMEGKGHDDSFAIALCTGICNKIDSFPMLTPGDGLKLKDASKCLPDKFAQIVVAQLESKLASGASSAPITNVSLKPQTLIHPCNYLTANEWVELENPDTTWIRKQCIVSFRLKSLGIYSMSEKTMHACMTLFVCLLSVCPDVPKIYKMLQEFKTTFAGTVPTAKHSMLLLYPGFPAKLSKAIYESAYGNSVPCSKSLEKWTLVWKIVKVRKSSKEVQGYEKSTSSTSSTTVVPSGSSSASSSAPQMPDMASMMQMMGMMWQHFSGHASNPDMGGTTYATPSTAKTFKPKATVLALPDAEPSKPAVEEPASTLPCANDAVAKPADNEPDDQPDLPEPKQDEVDYEQAAFDAIKAKQAKAKAKAKCKAKAKAKAKAHAAGPAKAKAKPKAKAVSSKRPASSFKYVVDAPTETQLQSTRECYADKHYHKARKLAESNGFSIDDAKSQGKLARADAIKLWEKHQ